MGSALRLAILAALILQISFVVIQGNAQSTRVATFFLPDSEPLSLDASIIAVNTVNDDAVTTLELACPTALSPENEACRSAGIYPAQAYHTQGSIWGGTTTYTADDSTTTWRCELGSGSDDPPGVMGRCDKTIVENAVTRTQSVSYDECYVIAHQLPIVVTAGIDKINPAHYLTIDASAVNVARSSRSAEAECPASQRTMWAGTVAAMTEPLGGAAVTSPPPTRTVPALGDATSSTLTSAAANRATTVGLGLLLGIGVIVINGLIW
ncbi:hypothetical protein MMYC01_202194 [Madurella mycetomatis]|uniref:Uncharacterized protein n=1 Tax=Madurella mycetomatis TaxID=100816 RepID=A0A175WDK7_9PEZI|nr:hypothetical protein MMYC01_202194 [Madurella mycetomatis]